MLNRELLDEIILRNDTNDWWQPEKFVAHTLPLLPPELKVLANPPSADRNYNCFIFALGLANDVDVVKDSHGFIYSAFVTKLIELKELKKTSAPIAGGYVAYQDIANYPQEIAHMGILQEDGSVISKWAWGPLVKHDVKDVPASYGNSIWYAKNILPNKARELYWQHKNFNTKSVE